MDAYVTDATLLWLFLGGWAVAFGLGGWVGWLLSAPRRRWW